MSSFNFKDNLTIDNNKSLKWLNNTKTTRNNILLLDNNNDLYLNSGEGSVFINNSNTNTYLNYINTVGNVIIGGKIGISTNTSPSTLLTIAKNNYISIDNDNGYLGLIASTTTNGSSLKLFGNNTGVSSGCLDIYSGNNSSGNISFFVANNSNILKLSYDGTIYFQPNGSTQVLNINSTNSTFTNNINILNTDNSTSLTSGGAITISGGISVEKDMYINKIYTNKLFVLDTSNSSGVTNGAIIVSGGLNISSTTDSISITSGGAATINGGLSVLKKSYFGGKLTINDSTISSDSLTGSLIVYGGVGINSNVYLRGSANNIKISPSNNGDESSIKLYSNNNFTDGTGGNTSWILGQNTNSIGSGNFCIYNSNITKSSFVIDYDNNTSIYGKLNIKSTENSTGVGSGGSLNIEGGCSIIKDVYIGGSINSYSDINLKENIKRLNHDDILEKIQTIKCYKYNFKNDIYKKTQIGLIAQEVQENFPELLSKSGDYLTLNYLNFNAILLECIKKLKTELDEIKLSINGI